MELAGYRLLERIQSATRHELWIAESAKLGRRVVVRFEPIENDAETRRTYLEQLTELQAIRHLGLCEILEIGEYEAGVFLVMPYYEGGTFSDALVDGMSLTRLIHIASELCDALHVLHAQGLTHGDVKATNVAFARAGHAVLIDGAYFDPPGTPMPFSPGYGSPERARGEPSDARGDVFSIGMLVLRALVGDLPWRDGTDGPIRTRSASDTLPALGPQHAPFESVLERMTAFEPSSRPSSVLQVKEAFAELDVEGELTSVAVKSDLIATQEIHAVLPAIPRVDRGGGVTRRRFDARLIVNWLTICAVVAAGAFSAGNGLYAVPATQRLLADLGIAENPALVEARLNAQALNADPKQNLQSIVAAFEAVLAFDPSDKAAQEGIAESRARWEADFVAALSRNDLVVAQSRLNDLLAIYPNDASSLAMFDELQVRRHALRLISDTVALLDVTGADSASAEMALHAFREVLRLYPTSAEAVRQLDQLAAHFTQVAAAEVELNNIQEAMDALSKAGLANSAYPGLSVVRERIQRAATLRDEIAARLADARALQRESNLIDPPARNAAVLYHSVLTTDPDNVDALQGLGDLSAAVVAQFEAHLEAREFGEIRNVIDRAKTVGLYPASIMHMESALETELNNIAEAANLVVQAEQYIADGFITEPASRNAVTVLLDARRLDASNTMVDELFARCVNRLTEVANDALALGIDDVASTYAALAEQVTREADI